MLGKRKNPPNIAFGIVLRGLRLKSGLSQESLGFAADLQRNYISLMELGQNQPTITTIFKLATALNIKPSELMILVENELK
ncbi:helix-turn-helix transcriptional regulator [Polynucleobacter sp. MG-Unter2-18]|uniref:helix-turn-helix domain-containing protein n=1 Tax=Polynucleobacter sp. MG-Unter2-18 TaxID=2081052 RepID=UPI001BFE7294|nr:helix-turn-helix transcriptional regulator [Polynucleobacter sp. MG-Unter2-18]QWD95235.1 helix-turn-helix transcriptional regulator [Polynucleobacter sp. MG-Unter2-18]